MGRPMAKQPDPGGPPAGRAQPEPRARWTSSSAAGATPATSPAEVARQSTVVITMVPDTPDVEQVLDGRRRRAERRCGRRGRDRHEQHLAGRDQAARGADVAERGGIRCSTRRSAAARSARSTRRSRSWSAATRAAFERVAADPRAAWATRAHRPHRRAGRRDRSARSATRWRSAARSPASARAFALAKKAGVDVGARAPGAARRLRREPRARGARRADAQGELQAGVPDAAVLRRILRIANETARGVRHRRAGDGTSSTQLLNALVASGGGDLDYSALANGAVRNGRESGK